MLVKEKRLNLKSDFQWARSGKRIDSKFMGLFVRLGDNTFPKIGIASASKLFKKASDRNRARRLTSATFESLYSRLPVNINILALPKAPILDVKSGDVLLELEGVLVGEHVILGTNEMRTPESILDKPE